MFVANIKSLPNSLLLLRLYKKYYIAKATPSDVISSHWKRFGSKINVEIDSEYNVRRLEGYGFGNWQYVNFPKKILNQLCNLSYFLRLPYKKRLFSLEQEIKRNLAKIGSYVCYDCFRQICSFIIINKHLKKERNENFNVLIIGDGHGFFSLLMKTIYPACKIVLFDIGKVLFFQCINLQRLFPYYKHIGILNRNQEDLVTKGDFIYCPAENIETVNSLKYKVIVSISAMQEMNYNTIKRYFTYIRQYATIDNLFYCSSRVGKTLPGGEKIEFSKYPWHLKDKYLVDEEPNFYRYFLSAKFPFFRFFDGPMHHRLAILYTDTMDK